MSFQQLALPPAVPKPCNDCPYRVRSERGWLGPWTAEQWLEIVHGEAAIACHQTVPTIPETEPDHVQDMSVDTAQRVWQDPGIRQCAGAAIFRNNVFKLPRNRQDAAHVFEANRRTVLADDEAFLEHHEP